MQVIKRALVMGCEFMQTGPAPGAEVSVYIDLRICGIRVCVMSLERSFL